jgi:predicted  nucleic acid-binding Zn-ribbon protein
MKKRVMFNNQIEPTPEESAPPKPFPRSSSTTGLSSLSRSVIQAEERQNALCETMSTVKEIIAQYENEIRVLKSNNIEQMKIIQIQQEELKHTKEELLKTKEEIKILLDEINRIWDS